MFPWRESGAPSPGQPASKAKPLQSGTAKTPALAMCSAVRHMFVLLVRKAAAPSNPLEHEHDAYPALHRDMGVWVLWVFGEFITASTHQRWEKGSRCRKSGDHGPAGACSRSCIEPGTGMASLWELSPPLAWMTQGIGGFEICLRFSNSPLIKSQMLKGIKRHEKCC